MVKIEENPDFLHLEEIVKNVLLVKDEGVIKLLCAAVIGTRLSAQPIWLFLVAGSGGGKTEFILALSKVKGIYFLSSLTKNTFISGQKRAGKQTSLLKQDEMQDAILTFKDFTTVLTINKDEKQEIMGQLREIYDGSYKKGFGTGEAIEWTGKIGLIAGVTSVIHSQRDWYAVMGERFIMYSLKQPGRIEATKRAFDNTGLMKQYQEEMQNAFAKFLNDQLEIPEKLPKIEQDLEDEILKLSEFTTRARSIIEREKYAAKNIQFVHEKEMPTRFASQLRVIASALMVINKGEFLTDRDKNILYKLALDSIPSQRRIVLKQLIYYKTVDTKGLALKLRMETPTVRIALDDLNVLNIIKRYSGTKRSDEWEMEPNYRSLLAEYEDIRLTDEILTEYHLDKEISEDDLNIAMETSQAFDEYTPSKENAPTEGEKRPEKPANQSF